MRIGLYPGWKPADARAEIEECLREASARDPFLAEHPPEIVYNGFMAEGYVVENAAEPEAVLGEHHRAVFGKALESLVTPAATDARYFGLYAGIPTLIYGPTCRNAHGFDEAVNLESVRKTTQALALFVADWCGLEPA